MSPIMCCFDLDTIGIEDSTNWSMGRDSPPESNAVTSPGSNTTAGSRSPAVSTADFSPSETGNMCGSKGREHRNGSGTHAQELWRLLQQLSISIYGLVHGGTILLDNIPSATEHSVKPAMEAVRGTASALLLCAGVELLAAELGYCSCAPAGSVVVSGIAEKSN